MGDKFVLPDGGVEFHADEVGEVTDEEYVTVLDDTFVGMAIDRFRAFSPDDDEKTVYYLYIVDEDDTLVGVMSLRELLNAPEDSLVSDHMATDLLTIHEGWLLTS